MDCGLSAAVHHAAAVPAVRFKSSAAHSFRSFAMQNNLGGLWAFHFHPAAIEKLHLLSLRYKTWAFY